MVNIQVYDANKKIETVRCDENETMVNLEKLEKKYGATEHSHIEKDTSKKTTMIRYYRESETHTIIISMSEHQAERVNDYLADYWEFVRLFDDDYTETEGDETMTEKIIEYTIEDRLSRNIREEDFKMHDAEGNTNFYIIETMDCGGELGNSYEVFMGKKLFNYYKTITGAKIGITKTFAQDENGNGLIPRDEINVIIVETVEKFSSPFKEDNENEGSETMTENNGYDRNFVLLEAGEFECDGRTFTYEGEPITVGDVVDNHRIDFKTTEGHNGSFHITETHHIMLMVHSYSDLGKFGVTYDEIVYAPVFDEIYATASDFIESMVGIANLYYDPSGEIRERVEYSSYKGRLLKDLVEMSKEELVAIDNEGVSDNFSLSDIGAYIDYLNQEAHNPNTWAKGVTITEEHIDYHIRHKIKWGIEYCEKYCSPSVEFFRLADKMYKAIRD